MYVRLSQFLGKYEAFEVYELRRNKPNHSCKLYKYSFRKPNEPLEVLSLTTESTGKIKIHSEIDRLTNCSEAKELPVHRWEFLDEDGHWVSGEGGLFSVEFKLVGGPNLRKNLTFLKWHARVDARYTGLIIKISLDCSGVDIGCILAKINGTYAYNTTALPTVRTHPVILTSTTSPTTTSPTTTSLTTTSPTTTRPTTTNPTKTNEDIYNQENNKDYKKADAGSKATGDAATIFGPILGTLGLICLIGLVYVVAARYRKMKKRQKDPETNSTATLEEFKEPIYDTIEKMDFDNPVYSDPALDRSNLKGHLGPLPAIPGSGSTYQTLNNMTRNSGYDNPPVGMKSTEDYDNPPVKGDMESPEDYDNPPANDNMQSTEDYDNPPVNNEAKDTTDYDKPPVKNGNNTPQSDFESGEDTFF